MPAPWNPLRATNVICSDSQKQVIHGNKDKNWGLEELINYVKSVAEIETNVIYSDLPKQIMPVQNQVIAGELAAIDTETPQQTNRFLVLGENKEIVSPSNTTNLTALIEDLYLSNANLVKQVTYLSSASAKFAQDLESYKVQFQAASSKLSAQNQELEANHQTIQAQTSSIEKLTTELAIAKELITQVQADYNEQYHQLAAEKDNCRDLRTRLNREQQHSLQLKAALEKCLEVPPTSYQLAEETGDQSISFTPKSPSIKPWTTQTRGGGNPIDLAWEPQHFPSQNNLDSDRPPMASPEDLELFSRLRAEDEVQAIAPEADIKPVASPINTPVKTHTSPSLVVYPSRPPKGRKSLASIELPSFVS
ncbi:MAG: hypothetical protein H0U45_01670 [Tatlockia sp.]|nr:hypothetical protein [Tatlockia sp.]